jgi:hypothetical protein
MVLAALTTRSPPRWPPGPIGGRRFRALVSGRRPWGALQLYPSLERQALAGFKGASWACKARFGHSVFERCSSGHRVGRMRVSGVGLCLACFWVCGSKKNCGAESYRRIMSGWVMALCAALLMLTVDPRDDRLV